MFAQTLPIHFTCESAPFYMLVSFEVQKSLICGSISASAEVKI